jgi:hypothetical protein
MEGVNQRRKRLLQNTPKARTGRAAERLSGLGGFGWPAGQGRWGGGGLWPGRLIWAKRGWQIFVEYAFMKGRWFSRNTLSRMGGSNRAGRHRRAVGWADMAS